MNNDLYAIVKAIINSKTAIIRHHGQQYNKDREITSNEKKALQNILDAYEALGGGLTF